MDRYMVQADRQIRNEQYAAALRTLDLIVELREAHDLVLPESFWMKRGEVALGAGDYTEAMASVTRYLEIAGRAGERYTEALELLDQAVEQGCAPERMTETLESVRACLALGADPNGADENGRTTLDWAAERNNPAVEAALVAAGADPEVAAAAAREAAITAGRPGTVFRDCAVCPEMAVVPAGSFTMGSPWEDEGPQHRVTIGLPFAVGVYEVTFAEWDACVRAGGCGGYRPEGEGWGRDRRPVINVNWDDAQGYVRWLSRETGEGYRLLTEAEWEYVARAGTQTARYWGESESEQCRYGNGYDRTSHAEYAWDWNEPVACSDGYADTAPVGSFQPNAFGLYDVLGNVWEWTVDCWNDEYSGAPTDGSAWDVGDCSVRVLRGGSWSSSEEPPFGEPPQVLGRDRDSHLRIPCRPDHKLTPASLRLYLLHGGPGGSAPWSRHATPLPFAPGTALDPS